MSQVSGANVKFAGWTESAYNTTPGTPVGNLLYVHNFALKLDEARDQDPTISGYRGEQRPVPGRRDVSGNVTVTPAPESIGFWLKHAIGTPVTTGAGPYVHTFTVASSGATALPAGMGFEVDFSSRISTPGRFLVYSGCRIAKSTFNFPVSGVPTVTFELKGANMDADNSATLDGTLTDNGHTGWGVKNITLVFDDGALSVCAESLSVTIDNDLDDSQFCIGNSGVRHALPEGFSRWSGAMTSWFDTAALMNKALADTNLKAVVALTRGDGLGTLGNESLTLTIPVAVLVPTSPAIEGPKGLKLVANFSAFREATELACTAVLKNAISSIT